MAQKTKLVGLVKVFDKEEHAEAFRRGTLYCQKLRDFQTYEDKESPRYDSSEGTVFHRAGSEGVALRINDHKVEGIQSYSFLSNEVLDTHVFCMYAVHTTADVDNPPFDTSLLRKDLTMPPNPDAYGEFAVAVLNTTEFLKRIERAAAAKGCKPSRGLIGYYDPEKHSVAAPPERAYFIKPREFADEREYRMVFPGMAFPEDAPLLEVGDLRDITLPPKNPRDFKIEIVMEPTK